MCARDLTTKIRTPPLWGNTVYLLTNSPEIRSAHFCAYFIAIAYSRKRTQRFYIINNRSVVSCASTWFTERLSIMWLYATYCENRQSTFRMRPYPPKLSNIIMSSSTPNEWSRSSTVLAIIGGPRRKWLARRNSHASLACRTSSSPQKLKIFGGPAYYGYLCGSSPMKKTILDLLHSNESKRNTIYSITQRYIRLNKNKGLNESLVLI